MPVYLQASDASLSQETPFDDLAFIALQVTGAQYAAVYLGSGDVELRIGASGHSSPDSPLLYESFPLVNHEGKTQGRLDLASPTLSAQSPERIKALKILLRQVNQEIERTQLEAQLNDLETRLQESQHLTGTGSWEFDIGTETLWCSDEFFRLCDLDYSEISPSIDEVLSQFHPDDAAVVQAKIHDAYLHGIAFEVDARVVCRDGGLRWLYNSVNVVRGARNTIVRLVGVIVDITERKRSDEAMQRSEMRLNEAQRIAQIGSWDYDVATGKSIWSHEMFRLFDIPPIQGEPSLIEILQHYHPDDGQRARDQVLRCIQNGVPFSDELRVLRPDGSIRWIQRIGQPVFGEDGMIARMTGVTMDITARKEVELAFKESEMRRQAIIEEAPILLFAHDTKGNLLLEGAGLTDISPSESAMFTIKENTTFYAHFQEALRGNACAFDAEYSGLYLHTALRPHRDSDGNIIGVIGVAFDITERVHSEEALRATEERLRLAIESAGLGMFVRNPSNGNYLSMTETYKAHFGRAENEPFAYPDLLAAIHPEDRAWVLQVIEGEMGRNEGYEIQYRCFWPDGSLHWIQASAIPIADPITRTINVCGVTQDITERKLLEMSREQALLEAEDRADRDPLTGLLNHRAFHRRLREEIARAEREQTHIAVAMLDLDNFKFFNDAYGHAIGDDVLREVANRLKSICRSYDVLARFGGDEYAILFPKVDEASATALESRIQTALTRMTYQFAGGTIPITVSVGVALSQRVGDERVDVVTRADERLRRAKTGGESETEADRARQWMSQYVDGFSMLDALVTAVDNKDRYTRKHSEDVMSYSLIIAKQLGIDEETQKTIAVAALLHDVGKIGVPDAILRKPAALTEEEFSAVRQHPEMGAAIVSAVPGLEATLDAVRHHHERWDGKGYPSGLCGTETPLMARLMAVADAFSAMTTDRPYRQGMPMDRALKILREGAGTQWDAECVAAFCAGFLAENCPFNGS